MITKSQAFKDFFAAYPTHRKGGSDAHSWKVWKSEKLTEQDAINALYWLHQAASVNADWRCDGNGKFVQGITRFIRERIWLTPVPLTEQSNSNWTPDHTDTSWSDGLDLDDPWSA